MQITVRKVALGVVSVAVLAMLGCERADPRLAALATGMAKDSVLAAMDGQPARTDAYLVKGQYIETMYYPPAGSTDPDDRMDRRMAPVVLIGGQLRGWGWTYWDSVAAANAIDVAPPK